MTVEEARRFYDAFGSKQDKQDFYEAPALSALVAHSDLAHARSLFELGCGTGRFAAELLTRSLPPTAQYRGVDVSRTMVALASARLAPFADRATVTQTAGAPVFDLPAGSQDRFLSTYVLDLLPPEVIRQVVDEAHRVLAPGGLLCLAGITAGTTGVSKLVMGAWRRLAVLRPALVGGCRPIRVTDFVDGSRWELRHHEVVVAYGVASEVLVARAGPT
jgi:SAM-dependent methyltransferase